MTSAIANQAIGPRVKTRGCAAHWKIIAIITVYTPVSRWTAPRVAGLRRSRDYLGGERRSPADSSRCGASSTCWEIPFDGFATVWPMSITWAFTIAALAFFSWASSGSHHARSRVPVGPAHLGEDPEIRRDSRSSPGEQPLPVPAATRPVHRLDIDGMALDLPVTCRIRRHPHRNPRPQVRRRLRSRGEPALHRSIPAMGMRPWRRSDPRYRSASCWAPPCRQIRGTGGRSSRRC